MPVELGGSGTILVNQDEQTEELQGIRAEQATAARQDEQTTELETLASAVRVGVPLESDPAVGVVVKGVPQVIATIAEGQTATATPDASATGIVTRVVDLAPAIPVGEEGTANPVTVLGTTQISGEVSQGRGLPPDTSDPWIVKTSDGIDAKEIATKVAQDAGNDSLDAIEADAEATRIAAESVDAGTPNATGQTASGTGAMPVVLPLSQEQMIDQLEAKLDAANTKLDTVIAAVVQLEGYVDTLEALIGRRGTPSDSTSVPSSAAAVSGLIFSGANTLRSVDVINTNMGIKYIFMVFNATALPADGATPIFRLPLPGGGSAHWDRGKNFSTGAYWAISTTEATLTVSGVANAVVDAEYGGT